MEELLKYMKENGIQDDIDNKRRDYTKGLDMNNILLNIIKTGELDLAENGENENENVNENDIYISPRVCACIENENFGINDFLSAHSGVKIDEYSGEISCIDWKLLHEKFIDSGGWLDENFKALSVIVKKYQTIITGQYDKKRKARRETTNDVLDRMLREEYARQKQ